MDEHIESNVHNSDIMDVVSTIEQDDSCLLRKPLKKNIIKQVQPSKEALIQEQCVTISGIHPDVWDDAKLSIQLSCGRIFAHVCRSYGVYLVRFCSKQAAQKCLWLSGKPVIDSVSTMVVTRGIPHQFIGLLSHSDILITTNENAWPFDQEMPTLNCTWRS